MHRGPNEPVNLSNDEDLTVLEIAERTGEFAGSRSDLVLLPRPQDDPERSCSDATGARDVLGWSARGGTTAGLCRIRDPLLAYS
jgi:nucleoside-diphosphate-sugar epimerase